jgi:hypothetical protein
MPDILILCPIFNSPVPTGFTTEMIILDTLEFELPMHCPACRKTHKWERTDAWVGGQTPNEKGPGAKRGQSHRRSC